MLAFSFAVAISVSPVPSVPTQPGPPPIAIPSETSVHLGISLRPTHPTELEALQRSIQDPSSPDYKRWLTPQQYGARFGQPAPIYEQLLDWLAASGFQVAPSPNRTFLEAYGRAGDVPGLLGIALQPVDGLPNSVHVPSSAPVLPPLFASIVLGISGLDTRVPFHHLLLGSNGKQLLGPQDLRRFYGAQPLLDRGFVGQGQQLAVLSLAEPVGSGANPADIEYFLRNISDARTQVAIRTLPNPQNDVDPLNGGGTEFDLDVEAQTVGSPGADSVTLVVAPASEVFTTGVNDIVNNLPGVTAVSISLGTCELAEQQARPSETQSMRNLIVQGTLEGQTWSAASGDSGTDDCRNRTAGVDFPSSIPEIVAAGGTQITTPSWDANNALPGYQTEVVWNDGTQGGAAGGGLSTLFVVPSYQSGLGNTHRSVPDIALIAGGPGIGIDATSPGLISVVEGTSVASPLSAGFFALVASRVGCRLGDVHPALYALGAAQKSGGTAVFHDIVTGNLTQDGVTGPSAAVGFDSASGWGSFDVQALADAWPACPAVDGGAVDAGAGTPYAQCTFIACDAGTTCTTLPEGPSGCLVDCNILDPTGCTIGTTCSSDSLFSSDAGPVCLPGCGNNDDCAATPGMACNTCQRICIPAGRPSAHLGDGCTTSSDCPSGASCLLSQSFAGGYCTQSCTLGAASNNACGCPAATTCETLGFRGTNCLLSCPNPGQSCSRPGYYCQPLADGTGACLPACRVLTFQGQAFDTCATFGSTKACDQNSGICGGPTTPDAGPDAGPTSDAGSDAGADAGPNDAGPAVTVTVTKSGCGCNPGTGAPDALSFLAALTAVAQTRRRRFQPQGKAG